MDPHSLQTQAEIDKAMDQITEEHKGIDKDDRFLAQVSYIRGYENHPNLGRDDAIDEMETAILLTNTHILPEEESSTEGAEDTASSVCSAQS